MAARKASGKAPGRGARKSAPPRARMEVEERRKQLLDLGLRAFGDRPYDDVSTEAIAAEAGISHGLLFHYFGSKKDYYLAVLQVAADELVRETAAEGAGAPLERLAKGLDTYFTFVERRAGAFATLLRGGVGSDPVARKIVDATREQIVARMQGDLPVRDPEDARVLATALRGWLGFVEAIALDWIDRRTLARHELVALSIRALAAVLPPGALGG